MGSPYARIRVHGYPLYVYELEGSPRIWANSSREDKYSLVKLAVPCVRGVLLSF